MNSSGSDSTSSSYSSEGYSDEPRRLFITASVTLCFLFLTACILLCSVKVWTVIARRRNDASTASSWGSSLPGTPLSDVEARAQYHARRGGLARPDVAFEYNRSEHVTIRLPATTISPMARAQNRGASTSGASSTSSPSKRERLKQGLTKTFKSLFDPGTPSSSTTPSSNQYALDWVGIHPMDAMDRSSDMIGLSSQWTTRHSSDPLHPPRVASATTSSDSSHGCDQGLTTLPVRSSSRRQAGGSSRGSVGGEEIEEGGRRRGEQDPDDGHRLDGTDAAAAERRGQEDVLPSYSVDCGLPRYTAEAQEASTDLNLPRARATLTITSRPAGHRPVVLPEYTSSTRSPWRRGRGTPQAATWIGLSLAPAPAAAAAIEEEHSGGISPSGQEVPLRWILRP